MKHILAIHKNEMITIANGDGTKTVIDMVTGVTYLVRGDVLVSMTQACCDNPDIHWQEVGSRYLSMGEVTDNLHDICECRNCGRTLYDESEHNDNEIPY